MNISTHNTQSTLSWSLEGTHTHPKQSTIPVIICLFAAGEKSLKKKERKKRLPVVEFVYLVFTRMPGERIQ